MLYRLMRHKNVLLYTFFYHAGNQDMVIFHNSTIAFTVTLKNRYKPFKNTKILDL